MRSTLRSLTLGLAAALTGAAMAQQPYTIIVNGVISSCYPGQMVTIETNSNTQPYQNFDVPVDPNTCTWSAVLNVATNPSSFTASTLCNGMIVSANGTAQFNFIMDSVTVYVSLDCGSGDPVDCNGLENGPDMPGTSCDDGDPQTVYDTWTPGCVCFGVAPGECWTLVEWEQVMDDGEPVPFELLLIASSAGAQPITYSWYFGWPWALEGTSTTPSWQRTFAPGETMACMVASVDANGCETNWSNVEGSMNCDGIMGSPNWPGLPCTVPGTTQPGIWSADCICEADTTLAVDCEGNPGGGALPGTPCTVPGTVIEGIWSVDCICEPNITDPCEADFWVIQAMGPDSMPVPYELWVWNLSNGGSGQFTFFWNFGDGSSSTEAFPTHTYADNGPYVLCLTINDNNGCTSTHCDTVSINEDGIYEGLVVNSEVRSDGFTVNVQNPNANSVHDILANSSIATWPNPVVDELNVAVVSELSGLVNVTITDLNGRVLTNERMSLGGGRSQLRIATGGLNAGLYMLRITDGSTNLSQRFVKTN